jgi:hypothetical protein
MVLEHPKLLLAESKQMTETLRKIDKASSDFIFIGDASLSAELLLEDPFRRWGGCNSARRLV